MSNSAALQKIANMRKELEQAASATRSLTGYGLNEYMYRNIFSGHDKYGNCNFLSPNREHNGLIFFSRPRLNLSSTNIGFNRILAPLNVINPQSVAFGIRCSLDTRFMLKNRRLAHDCPFVNTWSPFFISLGNMTQTCTGWPNWQLETTTTEGGYFQENQSFPIGTDRFYGTYDLSVTLKDVQYAPIRNTLLYWLEWIAGAVSGELIAYPDAIDMFRMDFTVSIYRFIFDETRQYITGWAKATGCFPTELPMGKFFDYDRSSPIVESGIIDTSFKANHIAYQDFARIIDFNLLVHRYCPAIETLPTLPETRDNNFTGIPYITATPHGFKMIWKDPSGLDLPPDAVIQAATTPSALKKTYTKVLSTMKDEIHGAVYKTSRFSDNLTTWLDKVTG